MITEGINLAAFIGLAVIWSKMERWHVERYHHARHLHRMRWCLILLHPTVIHGLREFCVHVVVYSGLVIGGH